MVVAYELPGVVSVRERGMGVRGGCAGATTVCSLCQDFRICGAMPEGGRELSASGSNTKRPRGS